MLTQRIAALVPWLQEAADALDRDAAFPTEAIHRLGAAGALSVPLPVQQGARDDACADRLAAVLTLVGQGNLSVGRILEAHVNALHLIARYGTPAQWRLAETATRDGALFALWVTDPSIGGLAMQITGNSLQLQGGKQFCSAAGHATHALVTAEEPATGTRMLVLPLGRGESVTALPAPLAGMRAAVTGAVDFSGCEAPVDACLGAPGDYLREPDFSAGAWRGSAVALGGLIALAEHAIAALRTASRLDDPHVQARVGAILIARETARHWVQEAARRAEDPTAEAGLRVATVGLARIAVETACLDAMRLVQRSVGLSAFRQGTPIERICRDLSTYLRQPAADAVLTESAAWFANHAEVTA